MSEKTKIAVEISAEVSKFMSSLQSAQAGVNRFSSGMQSALNIKNFAVVGIIIAVVEGLKKLVDQTAEAQKEQAKLSAVLKSTNGAAGMSSEAVQNLAKSLSESTTYSKTAILGAENLLLTFTRIGKDIFPEATESVLNMSQALGQDLKSSAIQLGKALQDPIAGATALRRVGVALTESQRDQIEQLMQQGKLQAAQKIILKELATEFGGVARAIAETPTGKFEQITNKIGSMSKAAGMEAGPAFLLLGKNIMATLNVFDSLGGKLDKSKGEIGLMAKGLVLIADSFSMIPLVVRDVIASVEMFLNTMRLVQTAGVENVVKYGFEDAWKGIEQTNKAKLQEFYAALVDRKNIAGTQAEIKKQFGELFTFSGERFKNKDLNIGQGIAQQVENAGNKLQEKQNELYKRFQDAFGKVGLEGVDAIAADKMKRLRELDKFQDDFRKSGLNKDAEVAAARVAIEQEASNKILGVRMQQGQQVTSFASNMLGQLQQMTSMVAAEENKKLEQTQKLGDQLLDAVTAREMAAAGIVEETTQQKYAKEISTLEKQLSKTRDRKKRADLQEQIDQKNQEKKKAEIEAQAQERKAQFDYLMRIMQWQASVRQFYTQRSLNMSQTAMATGTAVMQGFAQMGPIGGAIFAAPTLGMGAAMEAIIASQTPPSFLAKGALIAGSRTGTLAMLAEDNKAEAVLPLENEESMNRIREAIGNDQTVHTHVYLDSKEFYQQMDKYNRNQAQRVGARNFSYRSAF